MDTTEETASTAEYTVFVRLPPFWPDRLAVWFAQAVSQFELSAIIRQRTNFNYVVSQLNQQQTAEVEGIISPPEQEPYDRLKPELVRRLSTSREQRVRQLISHEEMCDRKQSQFLLHLKSLAPDVPDDFLRTICASRLPPQSKPFLPARLRAVCIQPPTSLTEPARLLPCLPQPASPLRIPTTQPDY